MKIKLIIEGSEPLSLVINKASGLLPSEQIKKCLEEKDVDIDKLQSIQFANHPIDVIDLNKIDDWYRKLEALITYNLRKNKVLLANENVQITPTDAQTALSQFYRLYPRNRIWQLAVDGQLYAKITGSTEELTIDNPEKGWRGYDLREEGSLNAFFKGLSMAMENIEEKTISEDFILRLHGVVTKDVWIGGLRDIGVYRTDGAPYFTLIANNGRMTSQGLADLLDKMEKGELGTSNSDIAGVTLICQPLAGKSLTSLILTPDLIKEKKEALFGKESVTSNLTFADYLLENYASYHYNAVSQEELNEIMSKAIESYNRKIHELRDPDDILQLIGETTQYLERIHPFGDANGRVFVNLLQNRLLIQNGFPPATLFQPNLYDAFGHPVEVLKRGMQNTLDIYAGKDVFGYHMHLENDPEEQGLFEKCIFLKMTTDPTTSSFSPSISTVILFNDEIYYADFRYNTVEKIELSNNNQAAFDKIKSKFNDSERGVLIADNDTVKIITLLTGHGLFERVKDLSLFSMQTFHNPIFYLSENETINSHDILHALTFTDDVLLKLDCIDQAISRTSSDYQAMLNVLNQAWNELVSDIPYPQYNQTNSDFDLQELRLQILRRSSTHDQLLGLKMTPKSDEEYLEKEEVSEEESLEKGDNVPEKNASPLSRLDIFKIKLTEYIDERRREASEGDITAGFGKSADHYKKTIFGIPLGFGANSKITAANKLLAILNNENDIKLTPEDVSALNDSSLGRIVKEFKDVYDVNANKPGINIMKKNS